MKTSILLGLLLISSMLLCGATDSPHGQFTEAECPIPLSEELLKSGNFKFGYISVPEFHGAQDSKAIELAVAIFKCRKDTSLFDPLVLNSGGPGMSNLEDFVPTFDGPLGNLFLNERDVVIIELRGLKHSRPHLHTPELGALQESLLGRQLTADELIGIYKDTIRSIQERFTARGINLSAYNYWQTAHDIAFVMEKLGYPTFALFGNSAGTIVAQYLLMDHADKVSALSLNAVVNVPAGFNKMCKTSVDKLESIFQEISGDDTYAKAYPRLKERFLATLTELNETPDTIEVQFHHKPGPTRVVLNGNRVTAWIFSHMYWNTQLPLSMHMIANRDYSQIIGDPGVFLPLPNFSNGSFWSMVMSSWPDPTREDLLTGSEYEPFMEGMSTLVFGQPFVKEIRDAWKVAYKPGNIKEMATHIPALMLNGGEDHVCLPGYVRDLSESFENAYCFIFDGVAHSPVDAGDCAILMMKQFLDNPHEAPDASCMQEFSKDRTYALPEPR